MNLNQNILPKQFSNGRLDIESPSPSAQFALFDKIPISSQCTSFTDAMTGNWNDTPMSLAFFSEQNMQIIQNGIRAGVYNQSGGKYEIGPQDCDSLKIIMRGIFLQYSANLPYKISDQIRELNKMVLEFSIPKVFGETQGYIKYLSDASTLVVPLASPICETQYHKRAHKMPDWF